MRSMSGCVRKAKWIAPLLALCAVAEARAAVVANRDDPLYRHTGDQKRTYAFPATGETIPYRIYVPTGWKPGVKLPLVVILHGGNLDENGPFDQAPADLKGILQAEAERHGFAVVSPNGYRKLARWGAVFTNAVGSRPIHPPYVAPEELARINPPAEQDVLNVVELMSQEYGIDRSRIFIMGNSRGSIGTLHLAAAHPDLWLAMAPSDGPIAEADSFPYDRLRLKGAVFVHGALDLDAPVEINRRIAQHVIERGITTEFIQVPGGVHATAWYAALPQTFDFLASFPRRFAGAPAAGKPAANGAR